MDARGQGSIEEQTQSGDSIDADSNKHQQHAAMQMTISK
jgi:hypothetical protein